METPDFLIKLESRLKEEKPGLKAQLRLVPDPRPGDKVYQEVQDSCQRAGVLVLLYLLNNRWCVLLTQRTQRVLHHRSQISFPGGQQDPGEDLRHTALRETFEEVGVPPQSLNILGELTPLFIPPSNFCIYPFVASAPKRPDFRPCAQEVAQVLEIPLGHLTDSRNLRQEKWELRGKEILVPFYGYQEHKIWGATAMVLSELLDIVTSLPLGSDKVPQ